MTHSQTQEPGTQFNFKVAIRIRPPLPRELNSKHEFCSVVTVAPDNRSVSIMEYIGKEEEGQERNPQLCCWQNFQFDYVYD